MNTIEKNIFLTNYRAKKDEFVVIQQLSADRYPAAKMRLGFVGSLILSIIFFSLFEIHNVLILSFISPVFFILVALLGNIHFFKRMAILDIEVMEETKQRAVEMYYELHTKNKRLIVYFELEQVAFLIDENNLIFCPNILKAELK